MKTWLDYVIDDLTPDLQAKVLAANIVPTDSLKCRWLLTIMGDMHTLVSGLTDITDALKTQVLSAIRGTASILCEAITTGKWRDTANAASDAANAAWATWAEWAASNAAWAAANATWALRAAASDASDAAWALRAAAWALSDAALSKSIDCLIRLSRDNPPTCDGEEYQMWQATLADVPHTDFRWLIYADWLDERGHQTVAQWYRTIAK